MRSGLNVRSPLFRLTIAALCVIMELTGYEGVS
jgi:hypothetical protein